MAVDLSTVQEFTDAEILKVLRKALVDSAIASAYSYEGQSLNRYTPEGLQRLIEKYEARVAAKNPRRRYRRTGVVRFVNPGP